MLERKHECAHNRRVVVQAEAMGRPGLKDDVIEERLNNQRLGRPGLKDYERVNSPRLYRLRLKDNASAFEERLNNPRLRHATMSF